MQITVYGKRAHADQHGFNLSEENPKRINDKELYLEGAPIAERADGTYNVGAGFPLQRNALAAMGSLVGENLLQNLPYAGSLGARLLLLVPSATSPIVAWHCPGTKREVRLTLATSQYTGFLNVPDVVFVKKDTLLNVFAVMPPTPEAPLSHSTVLYHAPLHNTNGIGNVCIGSVRYPNTQEVRTIDQLCQMTEHLFWGSFFNHSQHSHLKHLDVIDVPGFSKEKPYRITSLDTLWKLLFRFPELDFPYEVLRKSARTIGQMMTEVLTDSAQAENTVFDFESRSLTPQV